MSEHRPNFLLVLPRIVQHVGEGYVLPIGMLYISAALKAGGFNVVTLNLNHHAGDIENLLQRVIHQHHINIVGTGGLSPQFHLIKGLLRLVKKIDGQIVTIVGGGLISSQPEVAMTALEFADYGVIGEGEITICEFASAMESGGETRHIAGLIIKSGAEFITTKKRSEISDLNSLPWADYEGFELDKYLDLPSPSSSSLNSKRLINMQITRSCPYKCTFCFRSTGEKYRKRSLDHFFGELDKLVAKFRIEHVSIVDELFMPSPVDVREFCARIKKYGITWDADFSIKNVRRELLPIMKESGLNLMQFGLESADNRILASMNKGITIEKMESVLKMVHEHNITSFGAFIFGDVAETAETAAKTMKWWREHPQYLVHLSLIKPFPGSAIYDYACSKGIIKDRVQYLKDGCPQVNISQMSDEEFANLAKDIADASSALAKLDNVTLLELDAHGRSAMSAVCPLCVTKNTWSDVKLFSINYLSCERCAQKFHIPLPHVARTSIERNVLMLLEKYPKVAIWGMTLSAMDLFKDIPSFSDPRIFPVDIASSKQAMKMYGKQIHDPGILDRENIAVVIISVPFFIAQISDQVRENHPSVKKILDICQLIGDTQSF